MDTVSEALDAAKAVAGDWWWVLEVFFVVLATLLVSMLARRVLMRAASSAHGTRNILDDALFNSLLGPTRLLIWLLGISVAAEMVGRRSDAAIFDLVDPVRRVGVIALLAWFLSRLVHNYQVRFVQRRREEGGRVDHSFVDAMGKLLRAAIIITSVLVALQTLGFSVSGVLAFGGVGGIAVGFAARDLLANLFGGLTIYLDRPFAMGDWIRSPDREIEGTVEYIGWRSTAIRTFDKRLLYVPNSIFTTIAVENPSRMSHRRIKETIGIRYDDVSRVPVILEDIRKYLAGSPDIDPSQTLMVHLNAFSDSSVDFFIYCFTKTVVWTEFHEVKERVLLEIAGIIESHGGEIAYPTTTVHLPDELRMAAAAES